MAESGKQYPNVEATFIDAPRDPDLQALYTYWDSLRRGRSMPSRTDFDPAKVPRLLAHIILYNVEGSGRYTIRLVGEQVEAFVGRRTTGKPAGTFMNERGAEMIVRILDAVTTERAPRFRAGRVNFLEDKDHRSYEACFLPLSADDVAVNLVLAAVKIA